MGKRSSRSRSKLLNNYAAGPHNRAPFGGFDIDSELRSPELSDRKLRRALHGKRTPTYTSGSNHLQLPSEVPSGTRKDSRDQRLSSAPFPHRDQVTSSKFPSQNDSHLQPASLVCTPVKQLGRPCRLLGEGSPRTRDNQFMGEAKRGGGTIMGKEKGDWEIHTHFQGGTFKILLSRESGLYLISIHKTLLSDPIKLNLSANLHRMNESNVFNILKTLTQLFNERPICQARCISKRIVRESSLLVQETLGHKSIVIGHLKDSAIVVGEGSEHYWWRSTTCDGFVDPSSSLSKSCSRCTSLRHSLYRPPSSTRSSINSQQISLDPPQRKSLIETSEEASFLTQCLKQMRSNSLFGLYLKNSFSHLENQRSEKWDAALLSWAVNIRVHAGKKGYEALRQSKRHDGLPLPSLSTLKRKIQFVNANPGIDHVACKLFHDQLLAHGERDVVISFDEIYLVAGLRVIRTKDGYGIIGFTVGAQRIDCREMIPVAPSNVSAEMENLFSRPPDQPERDLGATQRDASPTPHTTQPSLQRFMIPVSDNTQASRSDALPSSNGGWKSLPLWSASSTEEPQCEKAKMALHFFASSVASHLSSSIGFFEVASVNHLELHHYVNQAILGVLRSSGDALRSAEIRWLRERQGSIEKPNPFYEYPPAAAGDHLRIVALCFDGSSHARTFAHAFGGSIRRYDLGTIWGKRLSEDQLQILGLEYPLQEEPILLIGDLVHILKRCRNSVMKAKGYLFFAPPPAETQSLLATILSNPVNASKHTQTLQIFWKYHASRIGSELYSTILQNDKNFPLSLSRLTQNCIALTSRTKMSYPLAKRAISSRVRLGLAALERPTGQDAGIEIQKRNNLAEFLDIMQALMQLRRTVPIARSLLHQVISDAIGKIELWKTSNSFYHKKLLEVDSILNLPNPKRFERKGRTHNDVFGFWHWDLYVDVKTMLGGFKSLLCLPQLQTKLVTTDVLESFFSTLRAGTGPLDIAAHRHAYRQAKICRIGDRISYLSSVEIRESTLTVHALLQYYQEEKLQKPGSQPLVLVSSGEASALPTLSLPKPFTWDDVRAWQADRTPPELWHHNYLAGWLSHKQLTKYRDTPAARFFFAEKKADSINREPAVSPEFGLLVSGMLYICYLLFGSRNVGPPNLHKCLTDECEVMATNWIIPESTGL